MYLCIYKRKCCLSTVTVHLYFPQIHWLFTKRLQTQLLIYKHEAFWGCRQTRSSDCFSAVKPQWPIQHTLNPAHRVLKTCQRYFQTMPITSALHMFVCVSLDLGYIILQTLLNERSIFLCVGLDQESFVVNMQVHGRRVHNTDGNLSHRCVNSAYLNQLSLSAFSRCSCKPASPQKHEKN